MSQKIYNFYVLVSDDDPENVRYVGTTTKKIVERLYQHKYNATHPEKRGLPVHKWMYSKYKNGGSISIKQIDSCSEEEQEEREQYWISYYKNLGYDLMNIDKGGKGVITKEKRSESSIQRSIKGHEIPIIALNLDGTFYKEYQSITIAAKELGFRSATAIGNTLKGRSKSAGNLVWIYKKDYDPNKDYSYKEHNYGECIYEFDINGDLIKAWKSIKSMINTFGYSYNGIKAAISNKTIYHDRYWSKSPTIDVSEFEKYYNYEVLNIETDESFKFRSQADICKFTKSAPSTVCVAIKQNKLIQKKYKIKEI